MSIDLRQFYQAFFEETAEHLADMERLLLALDVDRPDQEDLNAIFRAAHSIKGGSGTFGFNDLTEVTHVLESVLDQVRKHELPLRREMVDTFLRSVDVLRLQLAAHRDDGQAGAVDSNQIIIELQSLLSAAVPVAAPTAELPDVWVFRSWQIKLNTERPLDPQPVANLLAEFAELGALDIVEQPADLALPPPLHWVLRLRCVQTADELREMCGFVFADDDVQIEPSSGEDEARGYGFFESSAGNGGPGYGLFDGNPGTDPGYGFFTDPSPPAADPGYGFFDESVAVAPPVDVPEPKLVAVEPIEERARPAETKAAPQSDATSIRVGVEKVDMLINLVGELVITQAMLAQTAAQADPELYERFNDGLAQLERNTRDLQESVMSIRMMPIAFVFSRFPRLVRDLAPKLNKQVDLRLVGEGTELDRGLIEKLADPLTHLVRNSLDHGIELPEARVAAGKSPIGTITLQAYHQGGNIIIEIADDGAGLQRDKILAKAHERGLPLSDNMSDQEVWQLIFEPGFSTADKVTDVSGRGVGMDVVRRNIKAMGGRVDIESNAGHGSRIIIHLPLTLAILDGLSVRVGSEMFITPLAFIVESLQPMAADIRSIANQGRVVRVRGEYLPLVVLHELFGIPNHVDAIHQGILVILEADGMRAALCVDELIGQHQVVIKSLETNFRKVYGISAATIMGDGRVALILDVSALVRNAKTNLDLAQRQSVA